MRRHTIIAVIATASLSLVTACSEADGGSSSSTPSAAEASGAASTETSQSSDADEDRDVVDDPPSKDWQEALDAAHDEFSGDVSKIELEPQEDGDLEYKVELMSADTEYAVQYDADTLEKVSDEEDDLGDDAEEKRNETFDPETLIDLDEAVSTARDQQDGAITSWKIEGKDTGRVQYEFDVLPDGASEDVEVQIDAEDGSIINDS